MNSKPLTRLALSTAIAATLMSGAVYAQQTDQASSTQNTGTSPAATATPAVKASPGTQQAANAKNASTLQQVVVTGTASFAGIKKIDAAYSITSMSSQQIKEANPVSAADLLKQSPGIFAESSGGQTGANIEVAGFPSGGDAPFVAFQLNGSPVYPQSDLSFMDLSSMVRIPDDTIDRAEMVQGGPAVLYGAGMPGITANFILKEGTDVPSGDIGVTYGTDDLKRVDGFVGFKVANNWYGSFGGWFRSDNYRDPHFTTPGDYGGSLSGTLSRDWDSGELMFYAHALTDKNQFIADTPIYNPSRGQFSAYPGFNPLTGSLGSAADQFETIQTTPCHTTGCTPGGIPVNLADGRGTTVYQFGSNFDWDFGNGWTISNKLNYTNSDSTQIAFYNTSANPESLFNYISNAETADKLPAGMAISANYTNGQTANLNQDVLTEGLWYVHKQLNAISNEFHVSDEIFDGNTLTFGNYTTVYDDHDNWYLGNTMLLQGQSNPNPIVVNLTDTTGTYQLSSAQGFVSGPTDALRERWYGLNTAFFLTDTWKVGQWLFDAGIRDEREWQNGAWQNQATGNLDPNPFTLYNMNASYLAPGMTYMKYQKTAPSWTIGANYEITPNMSAYVRLNDGVIFPSFDNLRGGMGSVDGTPVEKVHNQEIGFKYQSSWVYVDASAYHRLFYGVPYSFTSPQGNIQYLLYGANTKGVNLSTTFTPFAHFSLLLSGDYMDGHYTNTGLVEYTNETGQNAYASMYGMVLQRQPKLQFRITPSYTLPTSWGNLRAWITYEYIGPRYEDQIESQPLGSYYDLAFGVQANVGQHWVYSVSGTNMTNQIGLTEGNAREYGFANQNGVILARSILGREVQGQVKYQF
ncbi:TonB-dependent receptor [Dyella mobilis]|uniref:TonB-dependent receptor n=1 Tax=Dyella mobilis TaxID=1849582 RepID=A0ABS2KAL1_9GAMM|nr:TonB-dependent receptor [Dyella mobilis]MBM7128222.1 TonB-dependent receptor [Dyella mobilis]GLQ99782.1 TonB-dependent receptor [Dyella mobilis]